MHEIFRSKFLINTALATGVLASLFFTSPRQSNAQEALPTPATTRQAEQSAQEFLKQYKRPLVAALNENELLAPDFMRAAANTPGHSRFTQFLEIADTFQSFLFNETPNGKGEYFTNQDYATVFIATRIVVPYLDAASCYQIDPEGNIQINLDDALLLRIAKVKATLDPEMTRLVESTDVAYQELAVRSFIAAGNVVATKLQQLETTECPPVQTLASIIGHAGAVTCGITKDSPYYDPHWGDDIVTWSGTLVAHLVTQTEDYPAELPRVAFNGDWTLTLSNIQFSAEHSLYNQIDAFQQPPSEAGNLNKISNLMASQSHCQTR